MVEAGVLIDKSGAPLYWHTPAGRTGVSLPDSRDLWEVIWENRHNILGFAHSHPGGGTPVPSHTDITTFAAVEAALGARLDWWITSSDMMVVCRWCGPGKWDYRLLPYEEQAWAQRLREISR